MNFYENVFIGRQDLSQQQMEALGTGLGLFVSQNGGEVVRSEYCGFRTLAYPIKKNHKGHYYIMQIKASAEVITELNRTMKINEDIVRFLIVKVDKFDNKENLITQVKSQMDDFNGMRDRGYRSSSSSYKDLREEKEEIDQAEKVSVAE